MPELQDRHEIPVAAGTRGSRAGAYVPVQQACRAIRRLYRATVDSWLTKFETFNPSADWRKWPFANVITETYTPWRGIVTGTDDKVAVAFAKLLRVAIMHRVTDSYGPWFLFEPPEEQRSRLRWYDKQEEGLYEKCSGSWTRRSPPSLPSRRFRPRLSAATTGSTAAISPSGSNMPIRSSCAWRCALAK